MKAGAGKLAPVDFAEVVTFDSNATVRIVSIKALDAKASLPGETSGPALLVTVEFHNGTAHVVNLDDVSVVMTSTTGIPVSMITDPTYKPFRGTAPSGSSASGQYLFRIDPDERENAKLEVKYSPDAPTSVFTGKLPNG